MSIEEQDEKVCAHGVCNCEAQAGFDYCSPYCAQAGRRTNNVVEHDESQIIVCDCGHPTCVG
jgi:hypothetical protein